MSERLFIRLGTNVEDPCSWLVWSEQEQEIIASGELANAELLSTLAERAGNRPVDALAPTSAMVLTQVSLPEKGQRQALKALPYMLEESIAQDVEQMHFVTGAKEGNNVSVAAVSHEQMALWLSWIKDAGLIVKRLLPDSLAVPRMECEWAALTVGNDLLLRTANGLGYSIPADWQQVILPRLLPVQDAEDEQDRITIANYSDLELDGAELHPQPIELPMLTLAKGALLNPINLLTGPYRPQREYSKNILVWKNAAIAVGVALLLGMVSKGINIYQTHQQIDELKAQQAAIYKKATGRRNTTNLIFQMNNMLKGLQGSGTTSNFFDMLNKLEPVFTKLADVKPTSLRFDARRNELRMQISAKDYADVDKFKAALQPNFDFDAGVISNEDDRVTTSLTLRSK
ncbi:type II secretion system protein GspL [Shewanella sp. 202IG2-18]|uniref:type II secretion system protein GspL n=1 Tax=Parashewanella hymeniacidonis TaxID=2807618 RepID=UPI001961EE13|nr:type II secretion system protein GspL [Parashewanella hymeniacidonis]